MLGFSLFHGLLTFVVGGLPEITSGLFWAF